MIEFYFSENQTGARNFPYRFPAPLLTPFPLSIKSYHNKLDSQKVEFEFRKSQKVIGKPGKAPNGAHDVGFGKHCTAP